MRVTLYIAFMVALCITYFHLGLSKREEQTHEKQVLDLTLRLHSQRNVMNLTRSEVEPITITLISADHANISGLDLDLFELKHVLINVPRQTSLVVRYNKSQTEGLANVLNLLKKMDFSEIDTTLVSSN